MSYTSTIHPTDWLIEQGWPTHLLGRPTAFVDERDCDGLNLHHFAVRSWSGVEAHYSFSVPPCAGAWIAIKMAQHAVQEVVGATWGRAKEAEAALIDVYMVEAPKETVYDTLEVVREALT